MKKIVSIVLVLVMALSAVSALAEGFTPAESYDIGERVYDGGEITLVPPAAGGGTVTTDVYAGIEGKDYTDEKEYTYNDFAAGIESNTNWDPLSWEMSSDSAILDYLSTGFYSFVLNSDKTGYSVVPELAAEMPLDVTAEYAGQYGVKEGETGKAWRIALNQDATWNNGDKITADDYVYSMQQLLNPKTLNRRADSYYAGSFVIYNAKNYVFAGGATYDLITGSEGPDADLYVDMWGFWNLQGMKDADGNECPQYVSIADETKYRDEGVEEGKDGDWISAKEIYDGYLADGAPYASYATQYVYVLNQPMTYELITGAEEEGTQLYVDMWGFWNLQGMKDENGNECPQYVAIDNEIKYRDEGVEEGQDGDWISAKEIYEGYLAEGAPYASYASQYVYYAAPAQAVTWDEVGFKKIDDYTIDFILANPVEEPAFYVPYNLSSSYLVYKPLYEQGKTFYANGAEVATEEEADEITSKYGKSLEYTMSYGPYMMTSFELDKEYILSRNPEWYGYRDGKHLGQYQTDTIKVVVIAEHATAMLAFEKGEIDGIALDANDMDKYGTSAYVKYGPNNGYTTKLTFNTDYQKLLSHGTNSQVLVIDEFRQAFSYCYDRKEFATAYTGAGTAGFGMLNEVYCYNPFTGESYRGNDYAKAGLLKVFDITYGEGGDYDTLDEAYEAMTGYDVEKAQALMKVAYDKAVAAGIYDGESPVEIEFRVYKSDEVYVKMFNYLNEHLQKACEGSGFEGKVSLKMTVDDDYYNTQKSGGTDMIFSTWGGASMQPFTILYECYCDDYTGNGQQMEYGFDTSKIIVNFTVNGEVISDTLQNWALWADNSSTVANIEDKIGRFTDYDYNTRCAFYAQLEACYMSYYPITSVYYRNTASMNSQKVQDATDEYINLVGFGGIQYLTYNYDDAEWADYIANNELVY